MRNQLNQEIIENLFLTSPQYVKQKDYWKNKLSGAITKTEIPFYGKDNDPAAQKKEMAEAVEIVVPGNLSGKLMTLCNQSELALYISLLTVLKSLIFRYNNHRDIIVISPVYQLSASADTLNDLLFIRDEIDDDITYKEFLQRISDSTFDAYENQDYPYEKILDQLVKENEKEDNLHLTLTDFGCLLTNIHGDEACQQIKTRLIFCFVREQEKIKGNILFDPNLLESYFIRQMSTHFVNILESVLEDVNIKISKIPFLSKEEIKQLIEDLNNTDTDFPKDKTIHQLFEEQAAKGGGETAISTYLDLTDVYDELYSENINIPVLKKLGKCCFVKNPFVFRFEDSMFLKALNIFENEEIEQLVLLRTHRENIIVVNQTVLWFLDLLERKFNLKSIFDTLNTAINKEKLDFWLYPVLLDEKTGQVLGKRETLSLDGKFEELVALIKALYRSNLIELVDYQERVAQPAPLVLPPIGGKIPLPRQSPKEKVEKKYKPGGPVLLLGDTPSIATTGLLYIASFLRRNGIEAYCQWNDFNKTRTGLKGNVERLLAAVQPKVVGISMKWFPHIARVLEICQIVKKYNPVIKVVVGGNTASFYKKQVIQSEWVDYVIAGDGEVPLLKICKGEEEIPNCVYKKNGKIVANPITYVQDGENSSEIFLSHLEDIFVSELDLYLNYHFYINTGKGCSQQCFYCAGCRDVQVQSFNRKKPFLRGIHEVRQDIIAAKKYTACFMFDFDLPMYDSLDYYEKIWEGIDLSNHFCSFYFWLLPSEDFIDLVVKTFKYVYLNIDMCSLSERHRRKLMSLKLVKPQPTDDMLFDFFEGCEKYKNIEVSINHIIGLPYFSTEDIKISDDTFSRLMKKYGCFQKMDWGRLHAQPGAPIVNTCEAYNMKSYAKSFEDFLYYSQLNLEEDIYPEILSFNYPYIYFSDENLNSKMTQFYKAAVRKLEENNRRKQQNVRGGIKITYQELNRKSDQLARALRNRGVIPGTIAALCIERSTEMIVGLLAILKTGAAYLPLDPKYPGKRIEYILKDSNVGAVLTQKDLINRFEAIGFTGNIIDILEETLDPGDSGPMLSAATPDSLAYVMYTSGSTGIPKGILVQHRSVVRLIKKSNYIELTRGDSLLLTGPIGFDITTFEIWGPLLNGLRLILADQNLILDADKLEQILVQTKTSILHLIPQLFNQLAEQRIEIFAGLKYLMVGGDSLRPQYINKVKNLYHALKILHMYGPTENTTFSTFFKVDRYYDITLPIGKPVSNSTVYIVDKLNQLKPLGVVGELIVGGEGLARGYLNNPELTDDKFKIINYQLPSTGATANKKFLRGGLNQWVSGSVGQWDSSMIGKRIYESQGMIPRPHPEAKENQHHRFAQHIGPPRRGAPGRRRPKIYKTGDLGRWLLNGNLEFSGRIDSQVKVRGHRIELAEIEHHLLTVDGIKATVVVDKEDENQNKYLCAYFVSDNRLDISGLRELLLKFLPDYMIPSHFVQLEKIPLTINGKVDARALPGPNLTIYEKYVLPRNQLEGRLVEIWAGILKLEKKQISIDADFFQIGGDSLKATLLTAKIHKEFDTKVPLAEFFTTSTIRKLSAYIEKAKKHYYSPIEPAEKKEYYVLSSAQKGMYFLWHLERDILSYNLMDAVLLKKNINKEEITQIFKKLIKRHEILRTSFELVGDEPVQRIHNEVSFDIHYNDISSQGTQTTIQKKEKDLINAFDQPFDLSKPPLLKIGLIKSGETSNILLVNSHHIISDVVSQNILMRNFTALAAGGDLPGLRLHYKDYAEWQNSEKERSALKQQEEYWLLKFAGGVPVLNLATDYPRPTLRSVEGNKIQFSILPEDTTAIKAVAVKENATLYMVLLAIFYVLLFKLSNQEDIVVGTPIANRNNVDLEQIIGFFVNVLVLRNQPSREKTFLQFLDEVRHNTLEAFENQNYPFEELVRKVDKKMDLSHHPLFDVGFAFIEQAEDPQVVELQKEKNGMHLTPYLEEIKIPNQDITLRGWESGDQLYFKFEYSIKLFKEETIRGFINSFERIVSSIIESPGKKLKDIEIMSRDESNNIRAKIKKARESIQAEFDI